MESSYRQLYSTRATPVEGAIKHATTAPVHRSSRITMAADSTCVGAICQRFVHRITPAITIAPVRIDVDVPIAGSSFFNNQRSLERSHGRPPAFDQAITLAGLD